jgi:hypothetical protein
MGDSAKAGYYKGLLTSKFKDSKSAQVINNPASLNPKSKDPAANKLYEEIYTLFIEGNFDRAIVEKKKADSTFGVNYWTPQMLYIEALYNVRQHNDSLAISGLQKLITSNPVSPLKVKAQVMIDVLRRRTEIEKYLTNLQITRDTGNNVNNVPLTVPVQNKTTPNNIPVKTDSIKKIIPLTSGVYTLTLNAPHQVLMVLEKVDQVYVNEAKNAVSRYNNENFSGLSLATNKDVLDADHSLLTIASFQDAGAAMQYYEKIKRAAPSELSWLPANKYSFIIITAENLQLLKTNKNLADYKKLLNTQFPGRF